MLTRTLGRSGIPVSAVGMGTWAIGGSFLGTDGKNHGWGQVDDAESIRAIHRALEMGVIFFDTADVYGAGHSEEVLGRALQGRRDQVVIATKFGNTFDEAARQTTGESASPDYIRRALEGSLRRLGTDTIDLYQFHIWGYPAEKGAAVRDTLEALAHEGKIRGYAWSTDLLDSVKVFAEGAHNTAVQMELNVFSGNDDLLAFCEEQNLASVNRSPLAMGMLTGKYTADTVFAANDIRSTAPWYSWLKDGKPSPEFLEKVAAVRDILTSGGRTLGQGALAWIWARSEKTIPIPGFKTIKQVEENAGAMQFGPLTADQMREIDQLMGRS